MAQPFATGANSADSPVPDFVDMGMAAAGADHASHRDHRVSCRLRQIEPNRDTTFTEMTRWRHALESSGTCSLAIPEVRRS